MKKQFNYFMTQGKNGNWAIFKTKLSQKSLVKRLSYVSNNYSDDCYIHLISEERALYFNKDAEKKVAIIKIPS